MGSTRLAGKAMLTVLGRPILSLLLERIRLSNTIDEIVVATSDNIADDPIEELCNQELVKVFRGSEEDALDRLYKCAKAFNMKEFVHLTADNPMIDPDIIDRVVKFYFQFGEFDYVSNNHPPTWPDGFEVEVIKLTALEKAWKESKESFQREHATPYIWDQPSLFKIGNVALSDNSLHSHRWTLDYPEDYEFIKKVFEEIYPSNHAFLMNDVLKLLKRKPEIEEINKHYSQETWYTNYLDKLRTIQK